MSRPLVDIRLENLRTRAAGSAPALDGVSLHVRYGELLAVLGPPGSGKTALLRAVAGFEPLVAGRILVDGQDVSGQPTARRSMGFVFHGGALWPHLTVRRHAAFGLGANGLAGPALEERLDRVLARLRLDGLADRRPGDLTLEQRRRLALARALAVEPRVLLLDEPLADLEREPRTALRLELAGLHRDLAVTTICATADAADALALGDRIAVMAGGRLVQVGDPETLYRRPASRHVALALGPASFLPVRVVEVRDLGVVVQTEAGDRVPVAGIGPLRKGARGVLVLRPEMTGLVDAAEARRPNLPGRVVQRVFEGARYLYEVDVGAGAPVRVERPAGESAVFRVGEAVRVELGGDTAVLLPED